MPVWENNFEDIPQKVRSEFFINEECGLKEA